MLLCRRDVEIGVLALKSLLRFSGVSWAVAISDDGSITSAQRGWIDKHIPNCRWLPRVSNDARIDRALSALPRLRVLYDSDYQPLRKLLHPAILAACPKVLVLDPDTAFFRRPERLLTWAAADNPSALFLHDHQDESQNVPGETREAFEELRLRLTGGGRAWSMPYYFFNSGLLAYCPASIDLTLAESYLDWLAAAPERYTTGKPGLWFGNWTPEQTAYQVIYAAMTPAAEPFGDDYRIGNKPGYTFSHFLWLQLVKSSSLKMLHAVVRELAAG